MKLKNLNKLILLTLIAISFMVSSCAPKFTPVYPEALNIQSTIKPGDSVKIVTKTDEEIQFKVKEITSDAFIGEKEQVLYEDILKLEKMTASEFKNVLIQTATVVIAIPILLLMAGCC